ncbi:MAG: DUF3795 domain-containing protein [Bacteroidia bacterium]|nr:DUF3795 domain-containing protein [Bacteroidia bacterium]
MKEILADKNLIAYCGLYCGACGKYIKGRCPGCKENTKAAWCQTRACCIENKIASCADCTQYENVKDCKKFQDFISRIFALIFNSNRPACIAMIKDKGYDEFAKYMALTKQQSLKR